MGKRGPLKVVRDGQHLEVVGEHTAHHQTTPNGVLKTKGIKKDPELEEIFDEIAPQINSLGWAHKVDSYVVEMLIRHYRAAMLASDEMFARGTVSQVGAQGHYISHPSGREFRSESALFLKYANSMGMTFQSRARTDMPEEDEDSPFEEGTG